MGNGVLVFVGFLFDDVDNVFYLFLLDFYVFSFGVVGDNSDGKVV